MSELDYLRRHQRGLMLAALAQVLSCWLCTSALDGGIRGGAWALSAAAYWVPVGLARVGLGPRLTISAGLPLAWGGCAAVLAGVPGVFWLWGMDPRSAW